MLESGLKNRWCKGLLARRCEGEDVIKVASKHRSDRISENWSQNTEGTKGHHRGAMKEI